MSDANLKKIRKTIKSLAQKRWETEGKDINIPWVSNNGHSVIEAGLKHKISIKSEISSCLRKNQALKRRSIKVYQKTFCVTRYTTLCLALGKIISETKLSDALGRVGIQWNDYYKNFKTIEKLALERSFRLRQLSSELSRMKENIALAYVKFCYENHNYPTLADLKDVGITRQSLRERFTNLSDLDQYARHKYAKFFDKVYTADTLIDEAFQAKRVKEIKKKYSRVIVSTIASGPHFTAAVKSTMNYCKRNNAHLILIPSKQKLSKIDPVLIEMHLNEDIFITVDSFMLSKNLWISAMEIDDKVAHPLAGLGRYIKKGLDSFIYASPKQLRQPYPVKKKGSYPRLLATTGAITLPEYKSDKYRMGKRNMLAHSDHMMGGIVVEINKKTKIFHTRQIQFNVVDGSFSDLGVKYWANGEVSINAPEGVVFGDLHSRVKDAKKFNDFLKMSQAIKARKLILHDIFDSTSVNPHEANRPSYNTALGIVDKTDLCQELSILAEDLNRACEFGFEEVVIVESNHDDMLARAIDSGIIRRNPKNALLAAFLEPVAILSHLRGKFKHKNELFKSLQKSTNIKRELFEKYFPYINEEKQLLRFAVELYGIKNPEILKWLDLDSSYILGKKGPDGIGFELADHGHKGANGSRGSISQSARIFVRKVEGHSHTDGQNLWVFRVGHLMDVNQVDYIKGGPSSWVYSVVYIYEEGQAQHLTWIEGEMEYAKGRITQEMILKNKKLKKIKEYMIPNQQERIDFDSLID